MYHQTFNYFYCMYYAFTLLSLLQIYTFTVLFKILDTSLFTSSKGDDDDCEVRITETYVELPYKTCNASGYMCFDCRASSLKHSLHHSPREDCCSNF